MSHMYHDLVYDITLQGAFSKDEAARRLSAAACPGVQRFKDIRKRTRKERLSCAENENHITDVIHWGSFPCQGLIGLNAGRTGMENQNSQLAREMNHIDGELALAFPLAAAHAGAESVASTSKSDKQAITKIHYDCPPVMCCPDPLSGCRRRRLYWLTWPTNVTADVRLKLRRTTLDPFSNANAYPHRAGCLAAIYYWTPTHSSVPLSEVFQSRGRASNQQA